MITLERKPPDESIQKIIHHLSDELHIVSGKLEERDCKGAAQRMHSFKLLGEHGLHLLDSTSSHCYTATDFSLLSAIKGSQPT